MSVKLEEKFFDRLEGDDNIRICKIGDRVDPMWGMSCVLLTTEQIKALLNGDCVWFTNEEYATVLRAEAVDTRPLVSGTWNQWRQHRISEQFFGYECNICHTIWDRPSKYCPHCGAVMEERICLK